MVQHCPDSPERNNDKFLFIKTSHSRRQRFAAAHLPWFSGIREHTKPQRVGQRYRSCWFVVVGRMSANHARLPFAQQALQSAVQSTRSIRSLSNIPRRVKLPWDWYIMEECEEAPAPVGRHLILPQE